jgi:hypothetical protein
VLLELVEGPVDVSRDLRQLSGRDGPRHLQDGIRGVVSGPFAELHLDTRSTHGLGQLRELGGERLPVSPEE